MAKKRTAKQLAATARLVALRRGGPAEAPRVSTMVPHYFKRTWVPGHFRKPAKTSSLLYKPWSKGLKKSHPDYYRGEGVR